MPQDREDRQGPPLLGLVVDRDPSVRACIRDACQPFEIEMFGAETGREAEERMGANLLHLLFVDPAVTGGTRADLVAHGASLEPAPVVIVLADGDDTSPLSPAVFDRITKPLDRRRLDFVVQRAIKQIALLQEFRVLQERVMSGEGFDRIVGRSEAIERARSELNQLSALDLPVWITGDAGTGKELFARTLHETSERSERAFICVNCAGMADDAWREGSTSGGLTDLSIRAAGGTLYLDGVTRLSESNQEQLLAILRSDVAPAASPTAATACTVRFVCGSERTPGAAFEEGRLIEGLQGRWARLQLPRLAERREDIALLARHFVATIGEINRLPPIRVSAEAIVLLEDHEWPGNVQELRNTIEHAVILAGEGVITPQELPDRLREAVDRAQVARASQANRRFRDAKREVVRAFERRYLADLLERHGGNVTSASLHAGMLRSALQRLLRKYGFKSADFRRRERSARGEATTRPR